MGASEGMTGTHIEDERLYAATEEGVRSVRWRELRREHQSASEELDALELGVYEGLRTHGHTRFFGLRSHLERLFRGIAHRRIALDLTQGDCARALASAAMKATDEFGCDARVRIDVLQGPALSLGVDSNVLISVAPWRGVPQAILSQGARLKFARGLRRQEPAIKSGEFVGVRRAWIRTHGEEGVDEYALVGQENGREVLFEGALSNIALVRANELWSAPRGVLPGVTMRAVTDLAAACGLRVVDECVPTSELETFDEAFFTTSVRGIVPVREIEGAVYSAPGPTTQRLAQMYACLVRDDAREVDARDEGYY